MLIFAHSLSTLCSPFLVDATNKLEAFFHTQGIEISQEPWVLGSGNIIWKQ